MKKFVKGCLMVAGAFAAVGVVLCIVGLALGGTPGWDTMITNYPFQNEELQISTEMEDDYNFSAEQAAKLRRLDISLYAGSFEVRESNDDEIHLEVGLLKNSTKIGIEEDTLRIEEKATHNNFWRRWFRSHDVGAVVLYLPADKHFEQVSIEVDTGEADITRYALQTDSMELDIGAGQLSITDMTANEAELDCGVGQLDVEGTILGDISAECGVGEINLTLSDKQDSFDYEIECGIGEVSIGDDSYSSLGVSRELDNGAEKKMQLDCGVGAIHVEYR